MKMGIRAREGQRLGDQTKIRLATIISLKATLRKIVRIEKRKIPITMRGLRMELTISMLVM